MGGDTAAGFASGGAVVLPAVSGLDLQSAVTVEAWVRPSVAAQNGGIFEKTVGGAVNSQYMLFLESGAVKFRVRTAAGGLVPVDGPALAVGSWSHVVGTFDGTTLRLYVNGALSASAGASPLSGGSGPSYIGRLGQNIYPFQGTLDEVAVFPVALSAERVRAHWVGGVALRVAASATAGGSRRATATAQASEPDPDPATNTLTFTSTVSAPRADLVLTGVVSPEPATVSDTLTYQVALTNKGPLRATGTTLTLQLPPEITLGAASPSQGGCSPSGQTLSCALGVLEVGAPAQLVADRPAGYWRLGEAPGSTSAADASGNAVTGSYDPGVTLGQPGAIAGDTAAGFASGGAVVLPAVSGLDLQSAVTVEAWVRPSVAAQNGGIFEKTVGGAVNSQYMLFLESGAVKFRVRTAAGGLVPVDGPALAVGSWSHVVGTFDGTTLRLYVNGALAASAPASAPAGGSGPSYIGRLGQNIYPFQGTLDEVAVFPVALAAERVRAHWVGGVALRVSASATAGGSLRATATAQASEPDPDPATNTLTFTSTVSAPRADLVLTGVVSPEPATVSDTLTYQVALTNKGPLRATGTTLTLQLPPEITLGAASPSQGGCSPSGQTLSCALGVLEVGAPAQLVADRPAGYWRLGEAPGSTSAADASGNAVTGSYDPGVTLGQPGAIAGDTAAGFASGGAVVLPAVSGLDLQSAVTVEAWVRPSVAAQNGGIFEKTVGGAVNSQYMLFLESGAVKFRVRAAGGLVPVDGPALAVGSWSHVGGAFDGTTLRLYVNGALAASAPGSAPAGGSGPSYIGRLGQNIYPFQGTLDEVAVFPVALAAERVRAHWA